MSLLHCVGSAEVADLLLQSGASIGTTDKVITCSCTCIQLFLYHVLSNKGYY